MGKKLRYLFAPEKAGEPRGGGLFNILVRRGCSVVQGIVFTHFFLEYQKVSERDVLLKLQLC